MLPSGTTVVVVITLLLPSNQQSNQKAADRIRGQPLSFDRAKSLVRPIGGGWSRADSGRVGEMRAEMRRAGENPAVERAESRRNASQIVAAGGAVRRPGVCDSDVASRILRLRDTAFHPFNALILV
jgi:hypothetical protein